MPIENIGKIIRDDPDQKGWLHGRPSTALGIIASSLEETGLKLYMLVQGKWRAIPTSLLSINEWGEIKVSQGMRVDIGIESQLKVSTELKEQVIERCRMALQGDYSELDTVYR